LEERFKNLVRKLGLTLESREPKHHSASRCFYKGGSTNAFTPILCTSLAYLTYVSMVYLTKRILWGENMRTTTNRQKEAELAGEGQIGTQIREDEKQL
ncbi:MAG: hypothetical protein SGBAC_009110, partial [Bacillariaceae sp.]